MRQRIASCFLILITFLWVTPAFSHELSPAYLELKETSQSTYSVLWKVPSKGEGVRLSLSPVFPDNVEMIGSSVSRFFGGSFVQTWEVQATGGLATKSIAIEGLSKTMTDALVRVEHLDGAVQVERLTPDSYSFIIEETPGTVQVATTYVVLGVEHILLGVDHLLFVLALLILVTGWKKLLGTITAFTVSHSITLAASTLGLIALPGPPVEAVIALSIVFLAREMVMVSRGERSFTAERPWVVAFVFGLLHGFGFAGVLAELGLPQNDVPLALLMFNVGVEIGQILFIAGMVLLGMLVNRLLVVGERLTYQVPAYGIGAVASLWLLERVNGF